VYAGAAREAVFSVPAVIRRVRADFVPLALRAPLVNRADRVPDADERWLYQRINRAKLAPQGICVLDARGQVLVWTQMFDDDQSVLDFLDHARKRFRAGTGGKRPEVTERYMRFPSDRVKDFQDPAKLPAVAAGHREGKRCPSGAAKGYAPPGSLVARLVGRALDANGKPLADTVRQEHYVEDRFPVPQALQEAVAKALAGAGPGRVRLPDSFAKACASHAHLGHIDVQPLLFMGGANRNKGRWKRCEFWAQQAGAAPPKGGVTLWRLAGESEVVSAVAINGTGVHNVRLVWEGFVEMKGPRMTRLLLAARGREKLEFAKDDHPLKQGKLAEVAVLPGGRPIALECGVRYGIIGEPVAAAEENAEPQGPVGDIPDEARKQLVEALGGPFLVFRAKVQGNLKLSEGQQDQLKRELQERVLDAMQFFQKLEEVKPAERQKKLEAYRREAHGELRTSLEKLLNDGQRTRLRQLELQREGAFALGGEVGKELKVTAEQRKQFMAVVREMQQKLEPVIKEAQSGADPEEIRPRLMKIRREHERRLEALLSEAQRRQWKKMLGKPLDLDE
jgi:hypothetical protein